MTKSYTTRVLFALFLLLMAVSGMNAQLSLIGQVRTRTEWRDGVGTLALKDAPAAFFTSQRTRLTVGYKMDRINFQTSVQDIRVWGQDASTISNADGSKLMVHEAWGEITLANKADTTIRFKLLEQISLRIGRQELLYDDSRLLGNLDWLQQARRHDAAVLRMAHKGWQIDLGAAFGQNTDAFGVAGTAFVPGNVPLYVKNNKGELVPTPSGILPLIGTNGNSAKTGAASFANAPGTNAIGQLYKSMQYLYLSHKVGTAKLSGLFFKDDFGKYRLDSVGNATLGYVYGRRFDVKGVNSRITYGLLLTGPLGKGDFWKKVSVAAGAYAQSGQDKDGKSLSAYHFTGYAAYQAAKKVSVGLGYDILSGNKPGLAADKSQRFDPLYGTPHKFWGLMDYFYVGTGSPAGGLANAYGKIKYTGKKSSIGIDVHGFSLANPITTRPAEISVDLGKYLGTETDIIFNHNITKFIGIEAGYCFLAATNSLEFVKLGSVGKAAMLPHWGYLMVNIRPEFKK